MSDAWGSEQALGWVRRFAAAVAEHKDELTALDAAIGDGDHGTNMDRGMRAVVAKLAAAAPADLGSLFRTVGMTLVSTVGGASGPLFGSFFLALSKAAADRASLDPPELLAAFEQGVAGVVARGRAQRGDKTMVDALMAAEEEWSRALGRGEGSSEALSAAAAGAAAGAEGTIPLVARKGRASYLGQRSAGHKDPGATTVALLLAAAAEEASGDRQLGGEGR